MNFFFAFYFAMSVFVFFMLCGGHRSRFLSFFFFPITIIFTGKSRVTIIYASIWPSVGLGTWKKSICCNVVMVSICLEL